MKKSSVSPGTPRKLPASTNNASSRNTSKVPSPQGNSPASPSSFAAGRAKAAARTSLPPLAAASAEKQTIEEVPSRTAVTSGGAVDHLAGADSLALGESSEGNGSKLGDDKGSSEELVFSPWEPQGSMASSPTAASSSIRPSTNLTGSPSGTGRTSQLGAVKASPKNAAKKTRPAIDITEVGQKGKLDSSGSATGCGDDDDTQEFLESMLNSPAQSVGLGSWKPTGSTRSSGLGTTPRAKASSKKDCKKSRTKGDIASKKDPSIFATGESQAADLFDMNLSSEDAPEPVESATPQTPSAPAGFASSGALAPPKKKTKKEMERQYNVNQEQIIRLDDERVKLGRELGDKRRQIQELTMRLRRSSMDLQQYANQVEEINKAHLDSARMMADASTRLAQRAEERTAKADQQIDKLERELQSYEASANRIEAVAAEKKEAVLREYGYDVVQKVDVQAANTELSAQESKAETMKPPQRTTEELQAELEKLEDRELRAQAHAEHCNERVLILQEKICQAELRKKEAMDRIDALQAAADNGELRLSGTTSPKSNVGDDVMSTPSVSSTQVAYDTSEVKKGTFGKSSPFSKSVNSISDKMSKLSKTRTGGTKSARFSVPAAPEWTAAPSVDDSSGKRVTVSNVNIGDDFLTGPPKIGATKSDGTRLLSKSPKSAKKEKDTTTNSRSGIKNIFETAMGALSRRSVKPKPNEPVASPIEEICIPRPASVEGAAEFSPHGSMDDEEVWDDFDEHEAPGRKSTSERSAVMGNNRSVAEIGWFKVQSACAFGTPETKRGVLGKVKDVLPSMPKLWGNSSDKNRKSSLESC